MKLGNRQLEFLLGVGIGRAVIVPDKMSRRMCELGLMKSYGFEGSFVALTTAGLRALADAADEGKISLFSLPIRQIGEA